MLRDALQKIMGGAGLDEKTVREAFDSRFG